MINIGIEDYIYGLIVFGLSLYVGYAVKFNKQYAVAIIILGGIFTAIQAIAIDVTGRPLGFTGIGKLLAGIALLISGIIAYLISILSNTNSRNK